MMKKGGLNFLSRRNQSLFDTNVQMKDFDSVEFVYDAVVIPDSGTAKVRSRPTIKHFSTFGDGAGVAVPTPTVPVLPSYTTPPVSHTGNTESLPNGGSITADDIEDGQILIPPPPTIAPPPPPPKFIPPSPTPSAFMGEQYSHVDISTLQPPSMPPPKPPSLGTPEDVDLAALRPPPMAPPKPPSYQILTHSPEEIPECPRFTPPLPPTKKTQPPTTKMQKMPPPKPTRISSMELPPSDYATPAFTPPGRPASSFISQNTDKPYHLPKPTNLTGQSDRQNMAVGVQVNGKEPALEKGTNIPQNMVPPVKPLRRNSSGNKLDDNPPDLKNIQATLPNQAPTAVGVVDSGATTVKTSSDSPNKTPIKSSATGEKSSTLLSAQDIINFTPPDPMQRYSPLLSKKLQNLKTNEPSNVKEAVTSPLALLMAAKERDKQKGVLSRENSTKSNTSTESTTASIQMSSTKSNTFTVTPRPAVFSGSMEPFTESKANTESPKVSDSRPEPYASSRSALIKNPASIVSPTSPSAQCNRVDTVSFIPPPPEFANSDSEDETPPNILPPDPPAKRADVNTSLNVAPIPNGPANSPRITSYSLNTTMNAVPNTQSKPNPQAPSPSPPKVQPQAPPSFPPKLQPQAPPTSPPKLQPQAPAPSPPKFQPQAPPAPPKFQPQAPTPSPPKFQPQAPPAPPKFQPQAPAPSPPKFQPQAPPAPPKFQPQTPTQSLTRTPPQTPPSTSANQATLLSILQKKMLEMDPKFAPAREPDTSNDEWNTPSFDEDGGSGASLNSTPKPKRSTVPVQSAGLDMKELENKVIQKAQVKAPASSTQSKQQFGMTFMVRPGTKQPITPIPKSE